MTLEGGAGLEALVVDSISVADEAKTTIESVTIVSLKGSLSFRADISNSSQKQIDSIVIGVTESLRNTACPSSVKSCQVKILNMQTNSIGNVRSRRLLNRRLQSSQTLIFYYEFSIEVLCDSSSGCDSSTDTMLHQQVTNALQAASDSLMNNIQIISGVGNNIIWGNVILGGTQNRCEGTPADSYARSITVGSEGYYPDFDGGLVSTRILLYVIHVHC